MFGIMYSVHAVSYACVSASSWSLECIYRLYLRVSSSNEGPPFFAMCGVPQQEEFASKTLQENSGNFSLLPGCSGNEPSACVSASCSLTEQCAQDPLVEDGPTAGRGCFYWVFLPSSAFLLKLRNRLSLMSRRMNGAPPTPSRWIPVHPPDS